MASWQVNQARTHFSDVLDQADEDGPQIITHHGKERAVVLSMDAYRALKPEPESKPKLDFVSFLLSIPKIELEDWEIERDRDPGREIDL